MRNLWYAAAVAVCAIPVLGAVPAQADPRGWSRLGRSLGLGPDGRAPIDVTRPTARQLEMFDGGVPLLGGLAGRPPVNAAPRTLDRSGMPPGDRAAGSRVDRPRPHRRAFTSEGRPIAGVDPQYK